MEDSGMNKPELVAKIVEQMNLTKKQVEEVTAVLFDVIMEALVKGDKVVISGFGTFEVKKRAARTGRNPKTKEPVEIPASKVPAFKPGKALKDAVAQ